jgi:hypothetical protein
MKRSVKMNKKSRHTVDKYEQPEGIRSMPSGVKNLVIMGISGRTVWALEKIASRIFQHS